MEKAVRDILVGMKAELSKGWAKGTLISEGGVCLYGALVRTANLQPCRNPRAVPVKGRSNDLPKASGGYSFSLESPEGRAVLALAGEAGETWDTLALWNDAPERTVDDITNAIDNILTRGAPLKKNARKRLHRTRELVSA